MKKVDKNAYTYIETYVNANGCEHSDFINLPVVKNGKPIGVVIDAVYENWAGYKLTLAIWSEIEFLDGKPMSISVGMG